MKPEAPAEIRGKFKAIDTNVPGIQICEHFPLIARIMDKVALIRSLHHKTGASHENGQRWMMTCKCHGACHLSVSSIPVKESLIEQS